MIETSAALLPWAEGVNVILIKQLAPTATLVPQLLVIVKSVESAPVETMLEMFTVAVPSFVKEMYLGRLVVFTG